MNCCRMESEDDMHDANEVESADDDFYSGMDSEGDNDLDYDPVDYDYLGNDIDESDEVLESRGQVCIFLFEALVLFPLFTLFNSLDKPLPFFGEMSFLLNLILELLFDYMV